jgi:hypothetical protein
MWALAALFLLKAGFLAISVTPLWDVPDEVVHFSTISDLASGRGVPRPGVSAVAEDLVARWNAKLEGVTVFNWASIHPPATTRWPSRSSGPPGPRAPISRGRSGPYGSFPRSAAPPRCSSSFS